MKRMTQFLIHQTRKIEMKVQTMKLLKKMIPPIANIAIQLMMKIMKIALKTMMMRMMMLV